jgi:hypothetical protein
MQQYPKKQFSYSENMKRAASMQTTLCKDIEEKPVYPRAEH